MPKCRQFAKSEPWLEDRSHRLGVFLEFRQRTINQSLPNQQRVDEIFGLGWRGIEIQADEIEWVITELQGFAWAMRGRGCAVILRVLAPVPLRQNSCRLKF